MELQQSNTLNFETAAYVLGKVELLLRTRTAPNSHLHASAFAGPQT